MNLVKIIGYLDFGLFWALMLFVKSDKNRLFLYYILCSFIFLHVRILADVSLFDLSTLLFFFIFYKKQKQTAYDIYLYGGLLICFVVNVFVGLYFSQVHLDEANYLEIVRIFPTFLFAKILIDECIKDPEFMGELVRVCRWVLLSALIFLVIQMALGISFSLFTTLNSNVIINGAIRYPGIFSDPQQFSQFLGAFSFLSLLQFDKTKPLPKKAMFLMIGSILAILAAGGRAGLLGWGVGFSLLLVFSKPKIKLAMLLVAGCIALLALNFQDQLSIFKRSQDMNESYEFREGIWLEAIAITKEHPIVGIGLNNYQKYVSIYNPNQVWQMHEVLESFDQPESGYLKIMTEVGGLGFLCLMLMILIPMIKSFFNFFRSRDLNFILLISAVLVWAIGFYSTYSFSEVRIKMFVALIVSLMIVQHHLLKTRRLDEEENETPDANDENLPHLTQAQ